MSRKKRPTSPAGKTPPEAAKAPSNAAPAPAAPRPVLPPPNPPRPNKWFLAVSIVLWVAWIGFLLFLAMNARHVVGLPG